MVLIKYLFNYVSQFLDSQYDYIYFFYGFSFFFLALICFNFERNRYYRLPWRLLGTFALIYGVGEWIELLSIMIDSPTVLPLLQPAFLGLSYFFLFEFARIGYLRLEGRPIVRRWVYVLLFFMIFVGSQSAIEGLNVSIRYFLGLPAGILAAYVVYKDARQETTQRGFLFIFSFLMAVYALLTGLIVRESDFLLADRWNTATFYAFSGIPVQFIRGALIYLSAIVLWFYTPVFTYSKKQSFKYRVNLKLSRWTIVWVTTILMVLGLSLTNFMDYYSNLQLIRTSKDLHKSPLGHLLEELSGLEKISVALSKTPAIRSVITSGQETEEAQAAIQKYFKKNNLRSCYVVDDNGEVVVSAGEKLSEKYSTTPYISMLYLPSVATNEVGYHITPVSGNRERVYSVSYPVKDEAGEILGYVVTSKVIGVKLLLQYRMMGILITMFFCTIILAIFIYLRKRESLIEFMEDVNRKLQEVDQLKTDFISIVSHDLKTPLTAINNAAAILMKSKLKNGFSDAYERELIEIITKNTGRQKKMIADLLDISKIEAGVLPMEIEYHDLTVLAQETVKTLQVQADEKNIKIETRFEGDRVIVPVDGEHIRRVFWNLLSNAIRYSDEGGTIMVEVKSLNDEVMASVADRGPGITRSEQQKIFSKFYQSSDASLRQKTGTGLGLFITKGLVESHGGRVWLESKPGEGTTFYFTLPKWRTMS